MTRARVVGAGLSGLAAAWRLAETGHDVEVVEASPHSGGLIGTVATPYGLVEQAANAFVWDDDIAQWFHVLGIAPLFASGSSRRRFLFTDGRPRQWPLGPGASAILALRLAGASLSGGLRPRGDESVETWGRRVLGHAATTRLLAPALQGIYAAPVAMLAAGAVFGDRRTNASGSSARRSRLFGGRSRLAAPPGGMGAIVDRLYEGLVARGVTFAFNRRVEVLDPAVRTVVCTSAPAAAVLVRAHAPALADALSAIAMTRMVTATAFFEPTDEDLRGFGVLFPRAEGVAALGALFNTEIFARGESYRSETWIYGAVDPAAPLPSSSSIVPAIVNDRARLTGRTIQPIAVYPTVHAAALPVYGPAVLRARERLTDLPAWLTLAGNVAGRIGVSALMGSYEAPAEPGVLSPPETRTASGRPAGAGPYADRDA